MILERLIVNNFRPFYSRQELDLTVSNEKTLILIKANNDVGKTSLFKAMQWCLYGDKPRATRSHVNRTAYKESEGIMSVTLIFTHDDDQYEICRSVSFQREPFGKLPEIFNENLSVIQNGEIKNLKTLSEQNEYIQSILPKDASKFFLFDGEEIQKYTTERPGEKIKESIEIVLGIQELRNARSDLDKIINDVDKELDDLITKKNENSEESKEIQKLRLELENIKSEISDLDQKILDAQENIKHYDEQLAKFNDIKEKVTERIEIKKEIDSIKQKIAELEIKLTEYNQKYPFLLASPLLKEISNVGFGTMPSWRRAAISALLSSNAYNCICGRPLTEDIKKRFRSKIIESDDAFLNHLASQANEICSSYPIEYIEKEFYDLYLKLNSLQDELFSKKIREDELGSEIGERGNLNESIKNFEIARKRAEKDIENYEQQKYEKEVKYGIKEREYRTKREKLAKKQYDKDIEKKQKYLELCKRCSDAIKYVIDKLVNENRKKVEELASETFLKLTNAPSLYQGLEITDDYEIKVKTFGGTIRNVWEQQPSAGQSQIIAMSFISALNKYTAREAPVIIDTPIGRLDPIHKENLIKYLPHIASQVIVLYQPNEIYPEDLRKIHNYISSEWELRRDSTNPDITLISRRRD